MFRQGFVLLIGIIMLYACQSGNRKNSTDVANKNFKLEVIHFGVIPEGDSITQYTLSNDLRMEVKVINYGGIITHLKVPDKNGHVGDVVLGFDDLEGYLAGTPYFGSIVGRYGNRIAKGKFTLDGEEYVLSIHRNTSPHGVTDLAGRFAIGDVEPETYFIMHWNPFDARSVIDDETGRELEVIVTAGEVTDVGEVAVQWP